MPSARERRPNNNDFNPSAASGTQPKIDRDLLETGVQTDADLREREREENNPLLTTSVAGLAPRDGAQLQGRAGGGAELQGKLDATTVINSGGTQRPVEVVRDNNLGATLTVRPTVPELPGERIDRTEAVPEVFSDEFDLGVSSGPDPKRTQFSAWLGRDIGLVGARPPKDAAPWAAFNQAENPFGRDADGETYVRAREPGDIANMHRGPVLVGAEKLWEQLEAEGRPFANATQDARVRAQRVLEEGVPVLMD